MQTKPCHTFQSRACAPGRQNRQTQTITAPPWKNQRAVKMTVSTPGRTSSPPSTQISNLILHPFSRRAAPLRDRQTHSAPECLAHLSTIKTTRLFFTNHQQPRRLARHAEKSPGPKGPRSHTNCRTTPLLSSRLDMHEAFGSDPVP